MSELKLLALQPQTKNWATVVPGQPATYKFVTEQQYMTDYAVSRFAHTYKKSGWDCMRELAMGGRSCV